MKKKKKEIDPLEKLARLTKLLNQDKVKVIPLGPVRTTNKWRSQDPKFAPKISETENLVEAGGMKVDPSLKDEYENWRKDKIAEQNERREQAVRKWKAAKEAQRLRNAGAEPSGEQKPA